ncbi:MAG: hypothetical protein AVDCRST_MAG74-1189, partial [uncultured Pyrinomonadaceae bacterium]
VFSHRHKIYHLGFGKNGGNDSLQQLRNARAIYGKNRNEFYIALFSRSRHSNKRKEANDRMPELQSAISNGV